MEKTPPTKKKTKAKKRSDMLTRIKHENLGTTVKDLKRYINEDARFSTATRDEKDIILQSMLEGLDPVTRKKHHTGLRNMNSRFAEKTKLHTPTFKTYTDINYLISNPDVSGCYRIELDMFKKHVDKMIQSLNVVTMHKTGLQSALYQCSPHNIMRESYITSEMVGTSTYQAYRNLRQILAQYTSARKIEKIHHKQQWSNTRKKYIACTHTSMECIMFYADKYKCTAVSCALGCLKFFGAAPTPDGTAITALYKINIPKTAYHLAFFHMKKLCPTVFLALLIKYDEASPVTPLGVRETKGKASTAASACPEMVDYVFLVVR